MIQEDYVSLKTAKLLRGKGFEFTERERREDAAKTTVPTQALVVKWLRSKGLHIFIDRYPKEYNIFEYFFVIKSGNGFDTEPFFSSYFETPEAAMERAITHCLENLK